MVNLSQIRPAVTRLSVRHRGEFTIAGLFVALVFLVLASLTIGRYPVPVSEIVRILITTSPFNAVGNADNAPWVVVEIARLPRILMVTLCGMGLALSGAALQGVFRNPLVGPDIVGVSAAAAFGGVLAILLSLPSPAIVGLAFIFGLSGMAIAFGLSLLVRRQSMLVLVLAGVIVGAFFGALVGLAEYVADPRTKLPNIIYWLLGSFAGATYDKLLIVAGVVLVAGAPLLLMRWRLNLLSLGETDSGALGINVAALRWAVIALVALIVAAQVSVSGGVGWVGLIVPHMARMLTGPDHVRVLPASMLLGGIYLLGMDDIARSAASQEIPIGLLTAVIGVPIFALLFWRTQARGWNGD